ncbi:MAG TPA: hypothetical protein VHR15_09795, partial [Ktedonobacterales bacterium]|nr:hypothetical protein [Ktedonobacterales bacterium]
MSISGITPGNRGQDRHADEAPWWMSRAWIRFLTDLLLFRSRRRYTLTVSTAAHIGATDPERRRVEVNPTAIARPVDPARLASIRGVTLTMRHDERVWQQALTTALVEHECGHIRFTGARPQGETLAWLWNSLEDERQERLLVAAYPELAPIFDLLGDAMCFTQPSFAGAAPLARCLLWRWVHDRPLGVAGAAPDPDLEPDPAWEEVRRLVEEAWGASTSEDVVTIARSILARLGLSEDAPPQTGGAASWCA